MFHGKHLKIGKIGEEVALKYILKKGYKVLERNYRQKFGEIDIIGADNKGLIIFFEVKTIRYGIRQYIPEDNMTYSKLNKMRKICISFSNSHSEFFLESQGWRMDLIAIRLGDDGSYERSEIEHYQNI